MSPHEIDWDALPYGGDLFGEMHLAEQVALVTREPEPRENVVPGLLACAAAGATAAWLADHYKFPIILLGLLVGLALNFIAREPRTHRGLDFASRSFLRWGIVLLGLQVTFTQISSLGPRPFVALLIVMGVTILAGLGGARLAGQSRYSGLLGGGATAICGASAALALYGVIGRNRLAQAQFALTLVGLSLASALAMSLYPMLATQLHLNDRQAGFLIGASIHDVAQAIGGGYAFSDAAGSYATIVKLSRVALLAPIVVLVGLLIGPAEGGADAGLWKRLALPWFITAFIAVVCLNSLVAIPPVWSGHALDVSKGLLLLAVTATAMRSRLDLLVEMGWRATIPVLSATVASFACALTAALVLL